MQPSSQVATVERICEMNAQLNCPVDFDEHQLVCSTNGEISKVHNGQVKTEFNFGGHPTSLIIDQKQRTLFIADNSHKAISVRSLDNPNDPPEMLKEFEGTSFIGPHSMVLSETNSTFLIQTVFTSPTADCSEKPLRNRPKAAFL